MYISLTPELESRVKAKVDSGLYNNSSEVIREALRFMDMHDDLVSELKLVALRKELAVGMQQLDAGQGIDLSKPGALNQFFEGIKTSGSQTD